MSDESPPKLDYADPELPRPGKPPDGYLGYRSDEPPQGTQIGCVGWIVIVAMAVVIIWVAIWMLGRHIASYGI